MASDNEFRTASATLFGFIRGDRRLDVSRLARYPQSAGQPHDHDAGLPRREDRDGHLWRPRAGIPGPTRAKHRLRNILEDTRKSYEFSLFRDMPHGWMNDTMPGRYRPKETQQVWAMILDFLARVQSGTFRRDRVVWKFESNIAPDYDFTKKVRLA